MVEQSNIEQQHQQLPNPPKLMRSPYSASRVPARIPSPTTPKTASTATESELQHQNQQNVEQFNYLPPSNSLSPPPRVSSSLIPRPSIDSIQSLKRASMSSISTPVNELTDAFFDQSIDLFTRYYSLDGQVDMSEADASEIIGELQHNNTWAGTCKICLDVSVFLYVCSFFLTLLTLTIDMLNQKYRQNEQKQKKLA